MAHPKAYDPQHGYQFQILCMNPAYDREYEHCDYAKDRADLKHLMDNYRKAYPAGYQFKKILLPRKFWAEGTSARRR